MNKRIFILKRYHIFICMNKAIGFEKSFGANKRGAPFNLTGFVAAAQQYSRAIQPAVVIKA